MCIRDRACDDLYDQKPGDDTTIAVVRVISRKVVNIFTGPPKNKEDDKRLVKEFMSGDTKKIVCGGTSATIVSRVLKRPLDVSMDYVCLLYTSLPGGNEAAAGGGRILRGGSGDGI